MTPNHDPTLQKQIETFHRSLDTMSDYYQQAILETARETLLKDLEEITRPPQPPEPPSARRTLRRISGMLRRGVLRQADPSPVAEDSSESYIDLKPKYSVTIVDPNHDGTPTGSLLLPQHTQSQKRRLFDE